MAIRAAKLHHLQIAFPTTSTRELALYLTRDFIHEGFLVKRGPQVGHAYRRRYFVLDDRKLMYLDHPLVKKPQLPFITSSSLIFFQHHLFFSITFLHPTLTLNKHISFERMLMPKEKFSSVRNVMVTRFEWESLVDSNSLTSDSCSLLQKEHGTSGLTRKMIVTPG